MAGTGQVMTSHSSCCRYNDVITALHSCGPGRQTRDVPGVAGGADRGAMLDVDFKKFWSMSSVSCLHSPISYVR